MRNLFLIGLVLILLGEFTYASTDLAFEWEYDTGIMVNWILVTDLYGDGNPMILASSSEQVYLLDGDGRLIWIHTPPLWKEVIYGVYAADLDNDTCKEVLVGSEIHRDVRYWGELYVIDCPRPTSKWIKRLDYAIRSIYTADLDMDNNTEIIIGAGSRWSGLQVFDQNGDLKWEHETKGDISLITTADMNNDGYDDIIAGSEAGVVYVFNRNGGVLWEYKTNNTVHSIYVGDLDTDGTNEVVIGSYDNNIYVINQSGDLKWIYETMGCVYDVDALDLDNDMHKEIITGSGDGNLRVLNSSGDLKWTFAGDDGIYSVHALDLANSNRNMILAGSDSYLYLLDETGGLVGKYRVGPVKSIYVADIDLDGKEEVVVGYGGKYVGGIYIFEVNTSYAKRPIDSIKPLIFEYMEEHTGGYFKYVLTTAGLMLPIPEGGWTFLVSFLFD